MAKKKIFALALIAHGKNGVAVNVAYTIYANNLDEATGRGIRMAKQRFEESDGWFQHQCSAIEILEEHIQQAL